MNKTSLKLEKLFLTYMDKMGETRGGFIGLTNSKMIEKCNPKGIGQGLQKAVDILESRLVDIEFQPYEYEKGKTRLQLKEALNALREMGKEMENRTTQESNEYQGI